MRFSFRQTILIAGLRAIILIVNQFGNLSCTHFTFILTQCYEYLKKFLKFGAQRKSHITYIYILHENFIL